MTSTSMITFNRQVETLVQKGYPEASGLTERTFRRRVARLRSAAEAIPSAPVDEAKGRLPFVIVIRTDRVPVEMAMSRVVRHRKTGHVAMQPVQPGDFAPIAGVELPAGDAYLLVDIDRGADTLNVRPEDALKLIRKRRRSPLTIEEGVAILTHHPDFLQKNNCFSLLASRRNDQRVPALWIDGAQRPKLGWCRDRNPHRGPGSASCKKRIGIQGVGEIRVLTVF